MNGEPRHLHTLPVRSPPPTVGMSLVPSLRSSLTPYPPEEPSDKGTQGRETRTTRPVFHLLRLVQGKLYRYTPRLIENLPKAGINLGFSFFICRTFIIGGFYQGLRQQNEDFKQIMLKSSNPTNENLMANRFIIYISWSSLYNNAFCRIYRFKIFIYYYQESSQRQERRLQIIIRL